MDYTDKREFPKPSKLRKNRELTVYTKRRKGIKKEREICSPRIPTKKISTLYVWSFVETEPFGNEKPYLLSWLISCRYVRSVAC